MLRFLLAAGFALGLAGVAQAQTVGQVAPGMPCVVTALQPSDDYSPDLFFCGDHAFAVRSLNYSNATNPAVWEALSASLGHMVTAFVDSQSPFQIVGTTMIAQPVYHVKVQ